MKSEVCISRQFRLYIRLHLAVLLAPLISLIFNLKGAQEFQEGVPTQIYPNIRVDQKLVQHFNVVLSTIEINIFQILALNVS